MRTVGIVATLIGLAVAAALFVLLWMMSKGQR